MLAPPAERIHHYEASIPNADLNTERTRNRGLPGPTREASWMWSRQGT